ncbi:MAG: rhodanese-related sulfurtransferase [Candidatus Puniceispirillaceae bacterium]
MHNIPKTNQFVVAALYQFISVEDVTGWQAKLRDICASCQLMGTLLIADEGLNGTISGRYDDMHRFLDWLLNKTIFSAPELKFAVHEKRPFHRMKVRLKKEIVTMGAKGISPTKQAGTYVAPQEWNTLIADPDVMVVDTRNDYEVAIGQFQGAVNPLTKTFREFPQWAEELAALPEESRPKKLAMYCTGGIRCEKSTALMKNLGFDDVYHLKGGILQYLEDIPQEQSLWEGECFVFDRRVAVDHDLQRGKYELCHACKMPLNAEEMAADAYVAGISCPHCIDHTSPRQRARFAERARQIELAKTRGTEHLGPARSHKKEEKSK